MKVAADLEEWEQAILALQGRLCRWCGGTGNYIYTRAADGPCIMCDGTGVFQGDDIGNNTISWPKIIRHKHA